MKNTLRQTYKHKRNSVSLFFWVWGGISLLCLLLIFVFSVSQRWTLENTLRQQAALDMTSRGQEIKRQIADGVPAEFADEEEYVKHLSLTYAVEISLLDGDGKVLCTSSSEMGTSIEYIDWIKGKLYDSAATDSNGRFAVYQTGKDFAYACILRAETDSDAGRYLYIVKDVSYMDSVAGEVGLRTLFSASFVFVLAFVVSAAISGMFTKPISEMQEKAKLLAKRDFTVDFRGEDYGREIVELADTLNFARDELSKTDKMQKELIANVSHDFKTPLTMIKAYASMIVEISGEDKAKREKHAGVIIDEADRLTALVEDLLDLSKLQSGITELNKEKFDLSEYVAATVENLEYLKEKHGYKIEMALDEGVLIEADKSKIGQVIYNLIGNAVNYTGEDKKVYVALKKGDRVARFTVRDTGEGIPEAEKGGIWDRYYRSNQSHKRPVQGTGLGLSIVRQVLERHGYRFGVDSAVGEGSTFYVDFPCEE
ncbi:MAG: hypothetical protein IKC37_02565 [Clostridia bacterium]|nr:hypothetical protein [Clostridia bacterium]